MKLKTQGSKAGIAARKSKVLTFKLCFCLFTFYFFLFTFAGCEAFVRKFSRKPKKGSQPVELVLAPEEYKGPQMSKEELYRQYFLYWKSWHDELISALNYKAARKRKLDCIEQAARNLMNMRKLLNPGYQKKLDTYISRLEDLRNCVQSDIYGYQDGRNAQAAERLKVAIMQGFSYGQIKDSMS